MDLVNQFIFIGALLILLSILAGMVSSRLGAPLLLVFLLLGMLAGEDGIFNISFSDYRSTFAVGSIALAIILFEGGLRTPRDVVRLVIWPALSLATVGVLLSAVAIAGVAHLVMGLTPLDEQPRSAMMLITWVPRTPRSAVRATFARRPSTLRQSPPSISHALSARRSSGAYARERTRL